MWKDIHPLWVGINYIPVLGVSMHFTLWRTVYIPYLSPFKYSNYVARTAFYCYTVIYFPWAEVKLQKTSFLLYSIMRYGQSGSGCKVILVKVACDNKIVTNTNYVLVKEITENTLPPPPLQKKKKGKKRKKSLHSNPSNSMRKIYLHERMSWETSLTECCWNRRRKSTGTRVSLTV